MKGEFIMKKLIRTFKRNFVFKRRNIIVSGNELVDVLRIVDDYLPMIYKTKIENCRWRDDDMWRINLFVPDIIWRPIKYALVNDDSFKTILTYKKGYMKL